MASFALLLSSLIIPAYSTCYYPGGQIIATTHTPCTTDTSAHCCDVGQVCLTNGLCLVTWDMSYWVGSCMDATWNSGLCFQEESCKKVPADGWSYSSPNIWHCFEDTTQWACGNSDGSIANETCANGEGFSFEVGSGRNPRVENGSDVFPDGYALVNDEAQQSPSPSPSPSSLLSPTFTPPQVSCPTTTSIFGANATQPINTQTRKGVSTGAAAGIGLGIGIPLLVWALAATAIAHRAQKRARASPQAPQTGSIGPQQYQSSNSRTMEELDAHVAYEVPANKHPLPELPSYPRSGTNSDTPSGSNS